MMMGSLWRRYPVGHVPRQVSSPTLLDHCLAQPPVCEARTPHPLALLVSRLCCQWMLPCLDGLPDPKTSARDPLAPRSLRLVVDALDHPVILEGAHPNLDVSPPTCCAVLEGKGMKAAYELCLVSLWGGH